MNLLKQSLWGSFLLLWGVMLSVDVHSQSGTLPQFFMNDTTVNDCSGMLMDSDMGTPSINYDHNENYTFTICVPQATSISISFSSFCTENTYDYLRFFDGPDTNSALIAGPISGNVLPPQVTSTGNCLTINFISDPSVACYGWVSEWYADVPDMEAPSLDSIVAGCNSNTMQVFFDGPVFCDSLYPASFQIPGSSVQVSQVIPNPCINDSATSFLLLLNNTFTACASLQLNSTLQMSDDCDSLWIFNDQIPFNIHDCPIVSTVTTSADSICAGDCVTINVSSVGGDCMYNYQWNNGWPNSPGPFTLCPQGDTTIALYTTDSTTNLSHYTSFTIYHFDYPNVGPDTSVCIDGGTISLPGSIGTWTGPGITGFSFDPTAVGLGNYELIYTENGCADSLMIEVYEVDAGLVEAACPGTPPFQLIGTPPGGYWTGLHVDSAGWFTPDSIGDFIAYYILEDCLDSIPVHVDSLVMPLSDSVCRFDPPFDLLFSPYGGVWSGTGIIDTLLGTFHPTQAGPGWHTLYYDINGCPDSVDIYVKPISAGSNLWACPYQDTLILTQGAPVGGYWTGPGITDSVAGTFDPGYAGAVESDAVLTYHYDGCTDDMVIRVRFTEIADSLLEFCITDPPFTLNSSNTGRYPPNGNWSGPAVTNTNADGVFEPQLAGLGAHTLYYTANTCTDSVAVFIYDVPQVTDTTICAGDGAVQLFASLPDGTWSGTGITDPQNGWFDPAVSGAGDFQVIYRIYGACADTLNLHVDSVPVIDFSLIDTQYCFVDTTLFMAIEPESGILQGPGVTGNNLFNPDLAGQGIHTLIYSVVNGTCSSVDSIQVVVGDTLRSLPSFDSVSVCAGSSVSLTTQAYGGSGGPYTYQWSHNLGQTAFAQTGPLNQSQWITVDISDGCSNARVDSFFVEVYPEIFDSVRTSVRQCHDSIGFAVMETNSPNHVVTWFTSPPFTGDSLADYPGWYYVEITDTATGCSRIDTVYIPGFGALNALFSVSPDLICVPLSQARFTFIDFSFGAYSGTWDFGDGSFPYPYEFGQYPTHTYADTGTFEVELKILNYAGCEDVYRTTICVEYDSLLYWPNAFTPNGDLKNDVFMPEGAPVADYHLQIFDRWGIEVFKSFDQLIGWDGYKQGERAPMDTYIYKASYRFIESDYVYRVNGHVYLVR